jgi:DNA mismatch repair protein MSH3
MLQAAWLQFLDDFAMNYKQFRGASASVSELDALLSLAKVSSGPGFCRPTFVDADAVPRVMIRGGRHPMLDALLDSGCVPNDTLLTSEDGGQTAMLVTGPNMGGKSCFIRQSALIVIMAQLGCYVPAESAEMHVVDCIFTRMGASDNIAAGRSTFQVELTEASYILSNATPRRYDEANWYFNYK